MKPPVRALFFSPTMPLDRAQARYRALAKVLHPDTPTGDTRLMQILNAELDALDRGLLLPAAPEGGSTYTPPCDPLESYYTTIRQRAQSLIWALPSMPGVQFEVDSPARLILALGNTYNHKETLKVYSFRWHPDRRAWVREVYI
jgi:hypothetical protein